MNQPAKAKYGNGALAALLMILLVSVVAPRVASAQPEIANASTPTEGVLFGGQLTPEDVAALEKAGYKSVLDLRGVSEDRGFDEPAAVEKAGMTYSAVPVDGQAIQVAETFENFFEAFESLERPIVVHCASGNRVGALYYAWLVAREGQDRKTALDTAKANGLRSEELAAAVDRYLDGIEH